MGNWKAALTEAVLEFFRTGILGGGVTAMGVILMGINGENGVINVNWQLVTAVFLISAISALMRAIDRFIHESDQTKLNGLMPW